MSISCLIENDGRWQSVEYQANAEELLSAELHNFKEWVAYRVIGPSGARCKIVREEQTEVQREVAAAAAAIGNKTGAKPHVQREVHVQQTLETVGINVSSQQPEWSACYWKNACLQAAASGVDIERMLHGDNAVTETLLDSQETLDEASAVRKVTQAQLYQATMCRLTAKLLNEAGDKQLQSALMAEGAAGLWDLASDSHMQQQWGLTGAALRGLMAALRKPILAAELQLPAVCAVWHALVMAKARTRLIQLGVVEALLHIIDSAFSHLHSSFSNGDGLKASCQGLCCELLALLSASLGALAVLIVDAQAREHMMSNRIYIKLLADIAAVPAELFRQHAASGKGDQQQQQHGSNQFSVQQECSTCEADTTAAGMRSSPAMPKLRTQVPGVADPPATALYHSQVAGIQTPLAEEFVTDVMLSSGSIIQEAPIDIPPALLHLQPQRLAAEVMAALLLRNVKQRMTFWGSNSSHYLLCLTSAQDPCVQLCGAAAIASMAGACQQGSVCLASALAQEPSVLFQMHASLHSLLRQIGHRQRMQKHNSGSGTAADGGRSQQDKELDDMLLEYASLALWVVNALLAPEMKAQQVLGHLQADAELFQSCLTSCGASHISPTVLLCLSGAVCTVIATRAAVDAAADSTIVPNPGQVVQALQPALSTVLQAKASSPEITHAKLLAAAAIMHLAACEHAADVSQHSTSSCVGPRDISLQDKQILLSEGDVQQVNPHPPFRGVLRDALLNSGLLNDLIDLAMHTPDNFAIGNHAQHAQVHGGFQHTAVLQKQVVAAACHLLVAVNTPLPPNSCAQVLEFVYRQCLSPSTSAVIVNTATTAGGASSKTTGCPADLLPASTKSSPELTVELLSCRTDNSTASPELVICTVGTDAAMASQAGVSSRLDMSGATSSTFNHSSQPNAPCYAATLWGLSQHEVQQQQLVLDGRWSRLLESLVVPALYRVKRAAALNTRRTASAVGYGDSSQPDRLAAPAAVVPRLPLQHLHLHSTLTSNPQTVATSDAAGSCSNKRAVEAAGVLQLCLQSCWLILQQEAKLRALACEIPPDLKALYVKGQNTFWAMLMNDLVGPELSESAKLGLSLLLGTLTLPDSEEVCLLLKTLALDSCWNLAVADKTMHGYLVEHGLPLCVASICGSAEALQTDSHSRPSSSSPGSAAGQLLLAAAGYLTAAVQERSAVEVLGGEEATVQLLLQLLTTCCNCKKPTNIDPTLLSRILSSLAWLSSTRDAAAACCSSRVVTALLDVLRQEGLAYKALRTQLAQAQEKQQQQEPEHASQGIRFLKGCSQRAGGKQPQSCKSAAATPNELSVPNNEQQQDPLLALPAWVLQAPYLSVQQPDTWLQSWLQRQAAGSEGATSETPGTSDAVVQPCASPGYHLGHCRGVEDSGMPPNKITQKPEEALSAGPAAGTAVRPGPCLSASSRAHSGINRNTLEHGVKAGVTSNTLPCPTSGSRKVNNCDRRGECDTSTSDDTNAAQKLNSQDGTEGMLALWALLNISTHTVGQVNICKKGLYTLIRLVEHCPDPQRACVAAAILDNLTAAHENAGLIYKAELRLKHATLLKQAGIKRIKSNPVRERTGSNTAPSATTACNQPMKDAAKQANVPASPSAAYNSNKTAQLARRTSKLEMAAESGVLTAVLGTTFRAMAGNSVSGEEHNAGVLLSRAGELNSRGVEQTFKKTAPPGYRSSSGSGGRPRTASTSRSSADSSLPYSGAAAGKPGLANVTGSFGSGVADYLPAAAGTPRSGRNFFFASESGSGATPAAASFAGGSVSIVAQAQDTKAGFMRWLQDEIPEAVGASDCASSTIGSIKAVPAMTAVAEHDGTSAPGGQSQGLAQAADLTSITTQDAEEAEWLEQQRLAQKLHEFYKARATQGALLRGSLGSSLRSSTRQIWSPVQAAGRAKQRQCEHLQQQPSQLTRPQSAPAGGRRNLSVRCTESSAASSPKSPGRSPSFGQSSSRPSSAASGTSRSRQCWSPTQSSRHSRVSAPCSNQRTHKHGAGTWRATDSFADVSSTAIGACASPSSQQPLNKCSIDPWSPAVVAYEQQAVPPDNKPWQAANQLLLVGPEDEVVQKIAGATTSVLNGRLPCESPADVLNGSLRNKETLCEIQQRCQLSEVQQSRSPIFWEASDTQPHGSLMDPDDLQSPHARSQGAAQSSDFSSLPVLAGEPDGLVLYHIASSDGLQSHGACEQKAASSIPGNAAMFGAVTASDNQQLDLRNDVHVTWTAGIAGGSADGTTTTAMASTVADVVQYNLRSPYGQGLTAQRTADAESHPRPYRCGSTATRNAEDDVILLQRPSTGYVKPNYGTIAGKQYIPELRGIFSQAVADSLNKHRKGLLDSCKTEPTSGASRPQTPDAVPASIPRPITVLNTSGVAAVRPVQVRVKGSDDTTLPERAFCFHMKEPPRDPALAMHVFEHIDGAKFCNSLFGHFLLPNGKLAHLYVPQAAVKQGYTVTLPLPPATPWSIEDWLPHGLPSLPMAESLLNYMQPGAAAAQLSLVQQLNWVPVPPLAPKPNRCTLTATRSEDGSLVLEQGPLRLKVVVQKTLEQRHFQKPLSAKTPKQRPSTAGAATTVR